MLLRALAGISSRGNTAYSLAHSLLMNLAAHLNPASSSLPKAAAQRASTYAAAHSHNLGRTVAASLSVSVGPAQAHQMASLAFKTASASSPAGIAARAAHWRRPAISLHAKGLGEAATAETEAASSSLSSSSSEPSPAPESQAQFVFITGAYVLPHPDKMTKGGEDWFYIADTMRSVGVADGVGGWAEIGVDAGAYARQLMGHAKEQADQVTAPSSNEYQSVCASLQSVSGSSNSQQVDVSAQSNAVQLQQFILEKAYYKTDVRGSSTACVLVLAGDRVLASNLGDSGFIIIRDGQVVFHSPQQQHNFNFPYQIGSVDSMSDPPQSAQRFELVVQPGDVLVLGTDGLWDNCFDEEILSVIRYCQNVNMQMDKTAQVLAHYARHRASDPKFASPFAYSAFQAGFPYMGGKMDDITVLVARVASASEVESTPGSGGMNFTMPGAAKSKM